MLVQPPLRLRPTSLQDEDGRESIPLVTPLPRVQRLGRLRRFPGSAEVENSPTTSASREPVLPAIRRLGKPHNKLGSVIWPTTHTASDMLTDVGIQCPGCDIPRLADRGASFTRARSEHVTLIGGRVARLAL